MCIFSQLSSPLHMHVYGISAGHALGSINKVIGEIVRGVYLGEIVRGVYCSIDF